MGKKRKETSQQKSSRTETLVAARGESERRQQRWTKATSNEARRVGKGHGHTRIRFRQNTAQDGQHSKGQSPNCGCFCHQHALPLSGSPRITGLEWNLLCPPTPVPVFLPTRVLTGGLERGRGEGRHLPHFLCLLGLMKSILI